MTKQECIIRIQNLSFILGRSPTRVEIRSRCGIHYKILKKLYNGNFNELLLDANLTVNKQKHLKTERTCANIKCAKKFTISARIEQIYCSKGCANTYTKLKTGIYVKEKTCLYCNNLHTRTLSLYCKPLCKLLHVSGNITKGQVLVRVGGANAYDLIRSRAKHIAKYVLDKKCYNCGYDKHVEIAHIKAISDYENSVTLDIINNPTNLIHLCPNCHWEYDNNLLELNNKFL